ncbi:MAG: DUF6056 family protein [Lachnospiraceae bacterium]|nr:DUF6056 family protein [Lachnospiraceae bacterium]
MVKKISDLYTNFINFIYHKKLPKKIYTLFFVLIFLISLLPLILVARKSYPRTDDLTYSKYTGEAWEETHSLLKVLEAAVKTDAHFYFNWGGGYASAFILSLQPGLYGDKYYSLTPLILMIAVSIAVFIFLDHIIRKLIGGDRLDVIFIAFSIIFLIFQGAPDISDSLFWHTGAMSYGLFWALFLLFAHFLVKYQFKQNVITIILATVLGFIIAGANYITLLSALTLSAAFLIYNCLQNNKKVIPGYISVFIATLIGSVIHIAAPGTAARFEREGTDYNPFIRAVQTIISASCHAIWRITEWTDLKIVYILIISLPIMAGIIYKSRDKIKDHFKYPLIPLIISVIWLCILFCPPYYGIGNSGSGRVESAVYFTYVVLLFINAFYILGWIYKKTSHLKIWSHLYEIRGMVVFVSLIALVLLVMGSRNNAYWALKSMINGEEVLYLSDFKEFIK